MRKFERVADWAAKYGNPQDVPLPERSTKTAVGYDFFCPTDITIAPGATEMIYTNMKVYMNEGEAFIICARSSFALKGISLPHGFGLFEGDYCNNPTNDGQIIFVLWNRNETPFTFKKGDKIGQGFFFNYLLTDDDKGNDSVRKGGFGSSGK